jgi:hypothetical protein
MSEGMENRGRRRTGPTETFEMEWREFEAGATETFETRRAEFEAGQQDGERPLATRLAFAGTGTRVGEP